MAGGRKRMPSFNSLFEMLCALVGHSDCHLLGVSILYLRCRMNAQKSSGLWPRSCFNSLFEMLDQFGAAVGAVACGLVSILFLRCPPPIAGGDGDGVYYMFQFSI